MPNGGTMKANRLQHAQFLKSAADLRGLPPDKGIEIAFSGRSNAGKSSAFNALCNRRGLARTSRTPGRTQLLNFFTLDDDRRVVDLPGYGFARVPPELRARWEKMMKQYLATRKALRGLVLVSDIRHALTEGDRWIAALCAERSLPLHVLLSKADKLNRGPAQTAVHAVVRELGEMGVDATVQPFSALKGTGVVDARGLIEGWLAGDTEP